MVQALGAQKLPQHARIRREARNGHANVLINLDNLFLVRGELAGGALESAKHHVRATAKAHGTRTLLYGLHSVLHLVQPTLGRPRDDVHVILIPQHFWGVRGKIQPRGGINIPILHTSIGF